MRRITPPSLNLDFVAVRALAREAACLLPQERNKAAWRNSVLSRIASSHPDCGAIEVGLMAEREIFGSKTWSLSPEQGEQLRMAPPSLDLCRRLVAPMQPGDEAEALEEADSEMPWQPRWRSRISYGAAA